MPRFEDEYIITRHGKLILIYNVDDAAGVEIAIADLEKLIVTLRRLAANKVDQPGK